MPRRPCSDRPAVHGSDILSGGPGHDILWGDWDPKNNNTVRVRTNGAFKLRNCEIVKHFCAHGETEQGLCLSPTGKPVRS